MRICRRCLDSKFVINEGLLCRLTHRKADFENECPTFRKNETIKSDLIDNNINLSAEEIKAILPEEAYLKIFKEQSLASGVIYGLIASLLGAAVWALITVYSGYQIGYMALAIGALVGYSVRIFGKGIQNIYGIVGASLALFGCMLGNLLSVVGIVAREESLDFLNILFSIDLSLVIQVLKETFSFMDLLFYGFAVYEGYKFSIRPVKETDLSLILEKG